MIMLDGKPLATLRGMVDRLLHEYANLRQQAPHLFETEDVVRRVVELRQAKNALEGTQE